MEDNNYLVDSFGNSIGSDVLEITGEVLEFTLDTCVGEDGVLKDIPFVGTALKLYNIGSKVHEKHTFYKLKEFIKGINSGVTTIDELEERKQKFLSNPEFRKQELEFILILIERYIGFEKPQLLAKLYIAYLDGKIVWEEFTVYAEVIDRFLLFDCRTLISDATTFHTIKDKGAESILRLVSLGLMTEDNSVSTSEARKALKGESRSASKISRDSRKKKYIRTEFGKKLADILR